MLDLQYQHSVACNGFKLTKSVVFTSLSVRILAIGEWLLDSWNTFFFLTVSYVPLSLFFFFLQHRHRVERVQAGDGTEGPHRRCVGSGTAGRQRTPDNWLVDQNDCFRIFSSRIFFDFAGDKIAGLLENQLGFESPATVLVCAETVYQYHWTWAWIVSERNVTKACHEAIIFVVVEMADMLPPVTFVLTRHCRGRFKADFFFFLLFMTDWERRENKDRTFGSSTYPAGVVAQNTRLDRTNRVCGHKLKVNCTCSISTLSAFSVRQ